MPEVVYPSSVDGKSRTWGEVFNYLPDECDDWQVINYILENIAMFNRFGCNQQCGSHADHGAHYEKVQFEHYREQMNKTKDDPEKRKEVVHSWGLWAIYIPEVYNNLGGAYREFKS